MSDPETKISKFLRVIDQSARIRILLAIGTGESCVCHLEAVLGQRQAYISQHLMALREADVLATRREGRYIYYRLSDTRFLELFEMAGVLAGIDDNDLEILAWREPLPHCECPKCDSDQIVRTIGIESTK
jgi:ArsR family transcriptional regulator